MDDYFGIKARLRCQLAYAGINLNHLEPKPGGTGGSNVKSHAECMMFYNGISVQDLKKGTFYEYLENGKNVLGKEIKEGDVLDIDEILRVWAEGDIIVPDEAACAEYEQAWEDTYGDPLDDKGKISEATCNRFLALEEEIINGFMTSDKAREAGEICTKEGVLTKEEIYGDDGPGVAEMAIFMMKPRSSRMGAKFA